MAARPARAKLVDGMLRPMSTASDDRPTGVPEAPGGLPPRALTGWVALVASLIALGYLSNAASGPPDSDVLYRYSTAVGAVVQYALMAGVVAYLSFGTAASTIGFRRPESWPRAASLTVLSLGAIWGIGALLNLFLQAGEEQGLVPESWDSARAGPFVANFVVIALVAPIVEETTYRGLGYAAVRFRFGPIAAIAVTALAFGLSHGLVVALPVLTIFGAILAALRWRTDSLYPPIILHAIFNAAALLAALTFGGGS